MNVVANTLIGFGLLLCLAGSICILCAKNFKQKLLLCSIIDSCGFLTFSIGIMLKTGFSIMTLKVLLVLFIALVVNPITSNKIAYSAFYHKNSKEEHSNDNTV